MERYSCRLGFIGSCGGGQTSGVAVQSETLSLPVAVTSDLASDFKLEARGLRNCPADGPSRFHEMRSVACYFSAGWHRSRSNPNGVNTA